MEPGGGSADRVLANDLVARRICRCWAVRWDQSRRGARRKGSDDSLDLHARLSLRLVSRAFGASFGSARVSSLSVVWSSRVTNAPPPTALQRRFSRQRSFAELRKLTVSGAQRDAWFHLLTLAAKDRLASLSVDLSDFPFVQEDEVNPVFSRVYYFPALRSLSVRQGFREDTRSLLSARRYVPLILNDFPQVRLLRRLHLGLVLEDFVAADPEAKTDPFAAWLLRPTILSEWSWGICQMRSLEWLSGVEPSLLFELPWHAFPRLRVLKTHSCDELPTTHNPPQQIRSLRELRLGFWPPRVLPALNGPPQMLDDQGVAAFGAQAELEKLIFVSHDLPSVPTGCPGACVPVFAASFPRLRSLRLHLSPCALDGLSRALEGLSQLRLLQVWGTREALEESPRLRLAVGLRRLEVHQAGGLRLSLAAPALDTLRELAWHRYNVPTSHDAFTLNDEPVQQSALVLKRRIHFRLFDE